MVVDQVAQDFLAGQERDAELLDLEAAGDVAQRGGLVVVGPVGQAEADDRQHHVAGAGDVVNLPGTGRQQLGAAVGAHQGHAVAVERDEHGLHSSVSTSCLPTRERIVGPGDRQAGRELGFETVGRHAVDAAVPRIVGRRGSGRPAPSRRLPGPSR